MHKSRIVKLRKSEIFVYWDENGKAYAPEFDLRSNYVIKRGFIVHTRVEEGGNIITWPDLGILQTDDHDFLYDLGSWVTHNNEEAIIEFKLPAPCSNYCLYGRVFSNNEWEIGSWDIYGNSFFSRGFDLKLQPVTQEIQIENKIIKATFEGYRLTNVTKNN